MDAATYAVGSTVGLSSGLRLLILCAPRLPGQLRCDGVILVPEAPPPCSLSAPTSAAISDNIRAGQVFVDPASGLEVRCTQHGRGRLSFGSRGMRRQPGPDRVVASGAVVSTLQRATDHQHQADERPG